MYFFFFVLLMCIIVYGDTFKKYCQSNQYKDGSWIEIDNLTSKSFYCCGFDSLDHRHNISICGGTNLKGLYDYWGSNSHRSQVGGSGCSCDGMMNTRASLSRREKFKWIPAKCTLLAWNSTLFCDLLGNRIIYFQGDSTMDQSFNTLLSMIYEGKGGCAHQMFFHREFG